MLANKAVDLHNQLLQLTHAEFYEAVDLQRELFKTLLELSESFEGLVLSLVLCKNIFKHGLYFKTDQIPEYAEYSIRYNDIAWNALMHGEPKDIHDLIVDDDYLAVAKRYYNHELFHNL